MGPELTPEQIAEKEQNEKDVAEFNKGLQALIERTRITIVAKIAYTEDGIRPVLKHARLQPAGGPETGAEQTPVRPKKKNGKK